MSVEIGQRAESAAALFLEAKGCRILDRNWRTRMCEIDIVAERANVIYFCEVKYRSRTEQGSGIDYITPKKLVRMRFAAESWVHAHGYSGDYQLSAIEVSGPAYAVTNAVRDLG
jgi:uncharacterized protein (TIGR00252 family)